ncbi:MAG TPA: hypothetical protein VFB80_10075 [Pirellulaceae bacterium]|nr:hypothetical protein [Pirellulaceae bacterium]
MSLNPYAAPQPVVAEASLARDASLTPFLAWERLRVWFNTILVLVVVVSALPQRELWFSYRLNYYCIEGAILANICFCVGLVARSAALGAVRPGHAAGGAPGPRGHRRPAQPAVALSPVSHSDSAAAGRPLVGAAV